VKKPLLILIIPFLSFGQGWEQIFGANTTGSGYYGTSAQQVQDGGYIVCGGTHFTQSVLFGMTPSDICIFKTDSNGEEQWSKTFGSEYWDGNEYWDFGKSIQQTTDGGYVIAGYVNGFGMGGGNAYLLKVDNNGEEQWSQIFDFGIAEAVQQTTDGGYIITGYDSSDIYLLKTDENGEQQWSQTFEESFNDRAMFVQQTTDGGYIMTGCTSVINSLGNATTDIYLAKINANGEQQWSQIFGGPGNDKAHCVQQTTDGGYIITGEDEEDIYNPANDFWVANTDVYLIKTNELGQEEWAQRFGEAGNDGGRSVQQTSDGGYIIAGYVAPGENQNSNIYLLKTNDNGEEQWSQTFGGAGDETAQSVQQTSDGGYIIAAHTSTTNNISNGVYLIKTDAQGNTPSTNITETPTTNKSLIKKIDVLGREATNKGFQLHIYDDGAVEKKYIIK
tara:strand:+ start:904 stop:2241 length:1338 start_codon:yes stop_codon:yes gene_type:complete